MPRDTAWPLKNTINWLWVLNVSGIKSDIFKYFRKRAKCEVRIALRFKILVFSDIMMCGGVKSRRFEGTFCLNLQVFRNPTLHTVTSQKTRTPALVNKEYLWKDNLYPRQRSNQRFPDYGAEFPTTNPWCPITVMAKYVLLNEEA
jgi:hypothetical protein